MKLAAFIFVFLFPACAYAKSLLAVELEFLDGIKISDEASEVIQKELDSENNSLRSYFLEVSYGKYDITSAYIKVLIDSSFDVCDQEGWKNKAQDVLKNKNIFYDNYEHIAFILPGKSKCAWRGLGNIYGKFSWSDARINTIIHEVGHNVGMLHACLAYCKKDDKPVPFSDICSISNYGNDYDVMGYATKLSHSNIVNKLRANFLSEEQVIFAKKNGRYNIGAIEDNDKMNKGIIIKRNDNETFIVEFRVNKKIDEWFGNKGLLISYSVKNDPNKCATRLINANALITSATSPMLYEHGGEFYDEQSGIKIKLISSNFIFAEVEVSGIVEMPEEYMSVPSEKVVPKYEDAKEYYDQYGCSFGNKNNNKFNLIFALLLVIALYRKML